MSRKTDRARLALLGGSDSGKGADELGLAERRLKPVDSKPGEGSRF